MNRISSAQKILILGAVFCLVALGCQTGEVIALANPTPTRTVTQTLKRPTFTPAPPTPANIISPPAPTNPPKVAVVLPTRAPTSRPAPTRIPPTVKPLPTLPPPPPTSTPDPYAGYYYRPSKIACVTSTDTRIQGTVFDNGVPQSGILIRVSAIEGGPPAIDDFSTGTDPSDFRHQAPELRGQYRLGLYEGQQKGGTWFIRVIGKDGASLSPEIRVATNEGAGCNTANVDFTHN